MITGFVFLLLNCIETFDRDLCLTICVEHIIHGDIADDLFGSLIGHWFLTLVISLGRMCQKKSTLIFAGLLYFQTQLGKLSTDLNRVH